MATSSTWVVPMTAGAPRMGAPHLEAWRLEGREVAVRFVLPVCRYPNA